MLPLLLLLLLPPPPPPSHCISYYEYMILIFVSHSISSLLFFLDLLTRSLAHFIRLAMTIKKAHTHRIAHNSGHCDIFSNLLIPVCTPSRLLSLLFWFCPLSLSQSVLLPSIVVVVLFVCLCFFSLDFSLIIGVY